MVYLMDLFCSGTNDCEKEIKCSASLAFYLFSPTRLINSIKHEHSCKILYIEHSISKILYEGHVAYNAIVLNNCNPLHSERTKLSGVLIINMLLLGIAYMN